MLKINIQFFGGRGAYSSSSKSLTPIEVDQNWLYKPMDNSQIFANPIEYVGNDLAREIVNNTYSFDYEAVEEKIENVSLASLKSVQAFVTENGINSVHEGAKDVNAVKFGNNIYLMDGNHRVAKAKLDGKKTYKMKVTTIQKIRG